MKKIIPYITCAVALLSLASCQKGDADQAHLEFLARELAKRMPVHVDEYTMLDSAVVAGDHQMNYYYTIKGEGKDSLDFDIEDIKGYLKNLAEKNIKDNETLNAFEKPVAFKYVYNNKNGKYLFDYTVKTKHKHN